MSLRHFYPSHPVTIVQNSTEILSGEYIRRGLNARGVAEYTDVGHVEGYISEAVQDKVKLMTNRKSYRRIQRYHTVDPLG